MQSKASKGGGPKGGSGGGGKPGGGGGVNRAGKRRTWRRFSPVVWRWSGSSSWRKPAGSFVGSGFGGQILGSAIGGQIEDAIARTTELGRALESLDMGALADSTLLVTAELREAVSASIALGDSQKAVEAVSREVLLQTGLLPENVKSITDASLRLSNAWDEVNGAVSGLLALLSVDFVNTLAGILSLVGEITKQLNTAVGSDVFSISGDDIAEFAASQIPVIGNFVKINDILGDILPKTDSANEAEEGKAF